MGAKKSIDQKETMRRLSKMTGQTIKEINKTYQALIKLWREELAGERGYFYVNLIGSFGVKKLRAGEYRNPHNNATVSKPVRYGVKFKIAPALKSLVNQGILL